MNPLSRHAWNWGRLLAIIGLVVAFWVALRAVDMQSGQVKQEVYGQQKDVYAGLASMALQLEQALAVQEARQQDREKRIQAFREQREQEVANILTAIERRNEGLDATVRTHLLTFAKQNEKMAKENDTLRKEVAALKAEVATLKSITPALERQ